MWIYIVSSIVVALTAFYMNVKHKMSFWKRLGVAEEEAYFPLGSISTWDMLRRKIAFVQLSDNAYKQYPKEKIVGSYGIFGQLILVIRDLDLAKRVLIKDFDHFVDRIVPDNNAADVNSKNGKYMAKMLIQMQGNEWKHMRSTLSPVFTSGKLKNMVPLIHNVSDELNEYLSKLCGKNIGAKQLMRDFSLDVIVSTAFGIEINTFKEPDNIFKKHSKRMVGEEMTWKMSMGIFLFVAFPKLLKWLDLPLLFDGEAMTYFAEMIKQSIAERKKDGIRRNDLIDLVIDAMDKEINLMEEEKAAEDLQQYDKDAVLENVKVEQHRWSDEELEIVLVSNALMTFIVAFDQVSNASSKILHHLAKNPDIQNRLYQEISSKAEETNSEKLDYASIMSLPYLDMVFHETLRHYSLGHLERVATKDYKIPDTDVTIPKGTKVRIAYNSIMKDEKYFADPERYNPENFSEESKSKRHPYAYSGFGHGPRNCIAMRFAILQVKLVISRIVTSYKILPCEKTIDKFIPDPLSRSIQPKGGLWFTVEKRS